MGARSKARKRALDILFESELRGLPTGSTLEQRRAEGPGSLNPYTVQLVEGVRDHLEELDHAIETASTGWPLARMPAVDRTILRLAVFELRYVDEVPAAVTLDEAVNLARELSTDESPSFVNGVLATIAGRSPAEPQ